MNSQTNLEKLQKLLREIFQFDSAELDFGIYRIMNYKRDVIENFVTQDLVKAIEMELGRGTLAEQSQTARAIEELRNEIADFDPEAFDADGNLAEKYKNTPRGKKYLGLTGKAAGAKPHSALEALIYSHLYTFFSRYYDNGDFMSKRRYSKKERYAIPYNGEEVYLHWANSDQYYIKTGEYFTDYTFNSQGITVHFKLQSADVEQDNVKGENRFFVPLPKKAAFDSKSKQVVIPFEFRPLTEKEQINYGKRNQQEKIIAETMESLPSQFKSEDKVIAALTAERRKTADGKSVSFLEHHLRLYTQRNTSDFFIHKNLGAFLEKELDFYLKNEVLNLGELEAGGEGRAEGWFQIMQVLRSIGHTIIQFLAQVEDFQKKLFEKKKFVTETNYCITVGNIPEEFYGQIAENEAQWQEWKELFHIDEEQQNLFNFNAKSRKDRRITFLKAHATLVLDTKHFDASFVDSLLGSFDDLDGVTDGLLVHSENFQALSLLLEKYRQRVQCIHIDPPYNTQTSGFLYKNDYQHSSWLAMMQNRVSAGIPLLLADGAYLCHIDENECEVLHMLLTHIGIPDAGTIIWDKKNPMLGRSNIATQHEYVLWRTFSEASVYVRPTNVRMIIAKAESLVRQHGGVNDAARREFASWIAKCEGLTGGERAYRLIDDDGRVFQSVAMGAPEPRKDAKFHVPLIHPVTKKDCPVPSYGWSRTPENLQELMAKGEIIFGEDETVQPRKKVFLTDDSKRQLSSVISDASRGKMDVEKLGLEFPYCHPVSLYEELFGAAAPTNGDMVLDYFAGSGTTGHAVINLNREDGCNRKFILVEMGKYFDTVLLPRIKKVIFTPEWKEGKPVRQATAEEAKRSPRIVKYVRLESYEDALNNISFTLPKGQQVLKFDDYLLNYMLGFETRRSETLLNVEKLESPFSYKLVLHEGQETRDKLVDIPETFNYLLGLTVKTRRVYQDKDRRYLVYRGAVDHREVAVIWRDTKGWTKEDLERDKKFVAEQNLADAAEEIFVNGDSFVPHAKALDPVFKHRMFGGG